MGLAPYGEPTYAQTILDNLIDLKPDGSFRLNLDYFDYCTGLTMTNARFDALFGGPPRKPEERLDQRHMDLAASIQAVTEEVDAAARRARSPAETGMKNLCLAGGVALNCVANGKLLRDGAFENIWIQPAAGDAGGALGAALAAYHIAAATAAPHRQAPDGMKRRLSRAGVFRERRSATASSKYGAVYRESRRCRRCSTRSSRRWPTARSSAGSRAAWSSARARSATARSSATRARRACSASST